MTSGYNMVPSQMVDLSAVVEDVLYRAPGKNELEIRKAISETARDFLRRTGVWKEMRRCHHVENSWYAFKHGYVNALVVRVDSFNEGICTMVIPGEPEGVAPIPCGIPMPRIGNPVAPTLAHFIEQGGYVLVSAPGYGAPPIIPEPFMKEDGAIHPVMCSTDKSMEGIAIFTLTLAFGGEQMPEHLIQKYGSYIADGAAHILVAGPEPIRTTYGDRYNNACDTLAMRMAHGGETMAITGKIIDGLVEV